MTIGLLKTALSVLDFSSSLTGDYEYGYVDALKDKMQTTLSEKTTLSTAATADAAKDACSGLGDDGKDFTLAAADVTACNCMVFKVNVEVDTKGEPDGQIRVQVRICA